MLELYEDPRYEDVQTCKLFRALEAAMQIQKRKVLVGPNDSVGIMLFNTVSLRYVPLIIRRNDPNTRTNALVSADQEKRERYGRCGPQERHVCVSANSHR